MYERWLDYQRAAEFDPRHYLEVKLEHLATSSNAILTQIAALCGLEAGFENVPQIELARVTRWQEDLPSEGLDIIGQELAPYFEPMGYER